MTRNDIFRRIKVVVDNKLSDEYGNYKRSNGLSHEQMYIKILAELCRMRFVELSFENYSAFWEIKEKGSPEWISLIHDFLNGEEET